MSKAKNNRYNDKVKPYLDDIREMVKLRATQKDIYTKLGVSRDAWFVYKKEHQELQDCFNNKEHIKEVLEDAKEELGKVATYQMFLERLNNKAFEEDATVDSILKVVKQIYPDCHQWLQLEYEKLAIERERLAIEREKISKGISNTQVIISNDAIKR